MIRFRLAELIADKAFRERRVLPLNEVAESTGIHRATLSRMANQPGANISTDVVAKLCKYFECQPGDVMLFVDELCGSDISAERGPGGSGRGA